VPAKDATQPPRSSASQTPILGLASDQNHLTAPTPRCSASRRFSAPASRILGQHTTAPTFSMCKQTISVRQTSGTRLRSANLQDLRPPVNDLQDFRPAEMLGQQTIFSARKASLGQQTKAPTRRILCLAKKPPSDPCTTLLISLGKLETAPTQRILVL